MPDGWFKGRSATLGPLGRAILPLYIGLRLPRVVALACYFDDSFDDQIHVIGGFLAPREYWDDDFAPAWRAIISNAPHPIKEFKATDCLGTTGREEFSASNGWTDSERQQLGSQLVDLILSMDGIALGVAAAFIWPGYINKNLPKEIAKKQKLTVQRWGYGRSMALSLRSALIPADVVPDIEEIQPVVDEKPRFFRAVQLMWPGVLKSLSPELASKIKHPFPRSSHEIMALQAADLLANETFKEIKARRDGGEPRAILERLISGLTPYHAYCVATPPLEVWNVLQKHGFFREYGFHPSDFAYPYALFKSGAPLRMKGYWGCEKPRTLR